MQRVGDLIAKRFNLPSRGLGFSTSFQNLAEVGEASCYATENSYSFVVCDRQSDGIQY